MSSPQPNPLISFDASGISRALADAITLHQKGSLNQAQMIYEQILKLDPHHFDALQLLGTVFAQNKDLTNAKALLSKALEINPKHAPTLNNLGNTQKALGELENALTSYQRALEIQPLFPLAAFNIGNTFQALSQLEQAITSYDRALAMNSQYVDAYLSRGKVFMDLKNYEKSLEDFDHAIQLHPENTSAHLGRALVLIELKQFDQALLHIEKALALNPGNSEAYLCRGMVQIKLENYLKAISDLDRAISLSSTPHSHTSPSSSILPNPAQAYFLRGNALYELKQFEEALVSFDHAIALKPLYSEAFLNRGNVLHELKHSEEALESYTKAGQLNPADPESWFNKAKVYFETNRHDLALAAYEVILAKNPDYPFLLGRIAHQKMLNCDWQGIDLLMNKINDGIRAGKQLAQPFAYQAISDNEYCLQMCAKIYTEAFFPAQENALKRSPIKLHSKIKLAYLCGEFRHQATSILMTGVYEHHDQSQFELFAFDNGSDDHSHMRQRIGNSFNHMIDIRNMDDQQAAQLIHDLEIDILVNLNGYFGSPRQRIFAKKPAPIQVNYLGFPGTIAPHYMDYLIADKNVIPPSSQQYYFEKIAYLPNSYQANDNQRVIADIKYSRAELGLPEDGIIYCCFNNHYKLTSDVFDSWMRILSQVKNSYLWCLGNNTIAQDNLRKEAVARGIATDRILFAPFAKLPEHLARHQCADLFLDTYPYNAHTTASDALWAGLPVLTRLGKSFPSRVSASLLHAIGMPELIAKSPEEYEAVAIDFGNHPEKIRAMKQKLAVNKLNAPLFNTALFTKDLEAVYLKMYEEMRASKALS